MSAIDRPAEVDTTSNAKATNLNTLTIVSLEAEVSPTFSVHRTNHPDAGIGKSHNLNPWKACIVCATSLRYKPVSKNTAIYGRLGAGGSP